jgi:hypothetical protein
MQMIIDNDQEIDLTPVHARIKEMQDKIAATPCTEEEAEVAHKEYHTLLEEFFANEGTTPEKLLRIKELKDRAGVYNALECLDDLQHTLKADLMYCPKKYVVVPEEEALISPAGFHPDDRVFFQTRMALHLDRIDAIPDTGVNMRAHRMYEG